MPVLLCDKRGKKKTVTICRLILFQIYFCNLHQSGWCLLFISCSRSRNISSADCTTLSRINNANAGTNTVINIISTGYFMIASLARESVIPRTDYISATITVS